MRRLRPKRASYVAGASIAMLALVLPGVSGAAAGPTARAWPGMTIPLIDLTGRSGYRVALQEAVRAWNRAGVGIRFAVTKPAAGGIPVSYRNRPCVGGRAGSASPGFHRVAARVIVRACPAIMRPLLLAHELGTVLGVPNDDRTCSLMNSYGLTDSRAFVVPGHCSRWAKLAWLPRLVDPLSVAAARAVYASPRGPIELGNSTGNQIKIDWRQPVDPIAARTIVLRGDERCPTEADLAFNRGDGKIYDKPAYSGLHYALDPSPGRRAELCYGVFTVSAYGRSTRRPGLVRVTYAPLPVAAFASSPSPVAGAPVLFTEVATVIGGSVTHWRWDFGDPSSGAADLLDTSDPNLGRTPSHVFAVAGMYPVTLTITDDLGRIATAVQNVGVFP
jgi:hypothetical protein